MSQYLVYFYALFSLVLFRFDFILLQIYFLFESFTLNCILFYFRNEYMVEGVLEQKKEDWSKYSARIRRYGTKICSPKVRSLARPVPTCGTVVPVPRFTIAAFSSGPSYPVAALPFYPFSCLVSKSDVKL